MTAAYSAPTAPAPTTTASTWIIDPRRSVARFSMTYMVVARLRGALGSIEGTMILSEDDPAHSSVTASIDVASITTGIGLRDKHLRSSDFFDVEVHPRVRFRSTRVERLDGRQLRVVGDLTIRGITKEVTLDTRYEEQPARADSDRETHFVATTILSRRAFGLGTGLIETARLIASDDVSVTLDITATIS